MFCSVYRAEIEPENSLAAQNDTFHRAALMRVLAPPDGLVEAGTCACIHMHAVGICHGLVFIGLPSGANESRAEMNVSRRVYT